MAKPDVPEDTTVDFSLEFVWKSTSFDRMNTALKLFKDYSASISGYLFHVLLGHEVGRQGRTLGVFTAAHRAARFTQRSHSSTVIGQS